MSQRLLRGKGRRTRKKAISNVDRLKKRVSRLERGRDMINIFTDTDDSDPILATPIVIKVSMSPGNSEDALLKRVFLKGIILQAGGTDLLLTRIVMVLDKHNSDPDNDTPGWTDVFRENEIFAHRAVLSSTGMPDKRFSVLYDRVFGTAFDVDATIKNSLFFQWKKNFKLLPVEVDATASTARRNGLYLMIISTGATTNIDVSTSVQVTVQTIP